MEEAVANTMSTFLESMGTVATWLFGQVKTVGETIVSTPFLLASTGIFFVGAAIGIFGRLLKKG